MPLNEILEEHSVKTISNKTRISENNLENLFAKRFENLKRVKTLGFISILERDYTVDLSALRDDGYAYYSESGEDKSNTLGIPIVESRKEKSKFFMLVLLVLLGYATWHFLTQFDKKHLSEMIPFIDESMIENFMGSESEKDDEVEGLMIGSVHTKPMPEETPRAQETVTKSTEVKEVQAIKVTDDNSYASTPDTSTNSVEVTQTIEDITPVVEEVVIDTNVSIVPVGRLWFGLVNIQTKEREHFSISDAYALDVSQKTWLVATSSAAFTLKKADEIKEFNDAKEHYFKIDENGVKELHKNEYIALGGWPQW